MKAPKGLQRAGKALWKAITTGALNAGFDLDEREAAVLTLAAHQADDIAALEDVLAGEGMSVPGSKGQPRLSAVVAELRQSRLALAKLLGELNIPDDATDGPTTAASKRARHAATSRYNRARTVQERRLGVVRRA